MNSLSLTARGRLRARLIVTVAVVAAAMATFAAISLTSAASARSAVPHDAQQCAEPYSATRDPSNPLALPAAPGADPLTGARFYVPGPRKGAAAGAIAQLVGLNPNTMPVDESWADFQADPEWKKVKAESEAEGALVDHIDHYFMDPTTYSVLQ